MLSAPMPDIAIQIQGLGKRYALGGRRKPYKTLRESLVETVSAPFRRPTASQPAGPTSFWALKDVNFTVNRGEVVGIIGRNGAGKSTLLKVLSRITDPTEGEVQIDGRVGSLLEVGTGFHPELTGRENVYLNGAILGMRRSEIARKFDEIIAFAETEKFLDTPVKFYSSGMYTRLAFAVAAHLDPEILIVDEVLAVGDGQFQRKCMGKMGQVAQAGRTVLFVSHNISAVREICSTAIWLQGGQVRLRGPVKPVSEAYLSDGVTPGSARAVDMGTCVLENVELLAADGRPTAVVDSRHPWRVRVTYTLRTSLVAGASVKISRENLSVFEVNEYIRGGAVREPGRYVTTMDLSEVNLAAGPYEVSVYLMSHHVAIHLAAEMYRSFTVSATLSGTDGSVAPFDVGGLLNVQPPIRTERRGDAAAV